MTCRVHYFAWPNDVIGLESSRRESKKVKCRVNKGMLNYKKTKKRENHLTLIFSYSNCGFRLCVVTQMKCEKMNERKNKYNNEKEIRDIVFQGNKMFAARGWRKKLGRIKGSVIVR